MSPPLLPILIGTDEPFPLGFAAVVGVVVDVVVLVAGFYN